jgi:methionyl-tRNA formyltransferase
MDETAVGSEEPGAAVTPPPSRERLRVGLLVDSLMQPAWVVEAVRQIIRDGIAEIACVVVNEAGESPVPRKLPILQRAERWIENRDVLAYAAYQRFDARRYPVARDAEAPEDLTPVIGGSPLVISVTPRMTKHCDYFPDDVVARIREQDLDVLLRVGFRILKGVVLSSARHGVWSFQHGDNTINRGGPAGFWEVMEGHRATGAVLQRLTEQLDAGHVIARSFAATEVLSFRRNRAKFYWIAAQLLPQALRRLRDEGPARIEQPARWEAYSQRLYVAPTSGEIARLFLRLAKRLVVRKWIAVSEREQWIVAYRFSKGVPDSNDVPDGVLYRFQELQPPKDRIWADPFPAAHEGRHFLFFEEKLYAAPRAHLAVAEVDEKGRLGAHRIVLERPYHLSYPHVFRWDGGWYMVPETFQERRVELYRTDSFPDGWTLQAVLLEDVEAVDPTIFEHGGRWWLSFASSVRGTYEASALHFYHAASPLGPWTPHRHNPVKVDVRSARPAGRVFHQDGRLYRPAQDGAPRYGTAIVVHELLELTPTTFREEAVTRISATWRPGLTGTHTINAAGGLTAIDARQRRSRFR